MTKALSFFSSPFWSEAQFQNAWLLIFFTDWTPWDFAIVMSHFLLFKSSLQMILKFTAYYYH
jgi:hypothetical protein